MPSDSHLWPTHLLQKSYSLFHSSSSAFWKKSIEILKVLKNFKTLFPMLREGLHNMANKSRAFDAEVLLPW